MFDSPVWLRFNSAVLGWGMTYTHVRLRQSFHNPDPLQLPFHGLVMESETE